MKSQIYLTDLENDHRLWHSNLTLQQDLLKVFHGQIADVSNNNTSPTIKTRLEQFYNRIVSQQEVIDSLFHDLNAHEQSLKETVFNSASNVEHQYFQDHTSERKRVMTQMNEFEELKNDFHQFLSKTY